MKKNEKLAVIIFATMCMLMIACSNDNNDVAALKNMQGVVLGTTSCHTKDDSLAYRIDVSNFEEFDFIITASLPQKYKKEGTEIKFDMKRSNEGIKTCTDNFDAKIFYQLTNITLIN